MTVEPSEPYVMGDLVIDYASRSVTLAGRPVELVAMEYRMLAELSANAGRVLTYQHLGGTGLGRDGRRRHAAHAHPNQQAPAQAGRRRRQPDVHIHRAPRRLPDAEGGGAGW